MGGSMPHLDCYGRLREETPQKEGRPLKRAPEEVKPLDLDQGEWAEIRKTQELRPLTRGDCVNGIRPCPWVGCKYHLYLEVRGNKILAPNVDPWELEDSCSLDLAEKRQGMTLDEIGTIFGLTRERVRQIQHIALDKVGPGLRRIFSAHRGSFE
jgi:hypothetical protein